MFVRLGDAPVEVNLGAGDAGAQRIVNNEIPGALVQVHRDARHRDHAVGKQQQVGGVEPHAAVEGLT